MSESDPLRHVPVRPNLRQLKQQAKDLLQAIKSGDQTALQEFNQSHPNAGTISAEQIKLHDAQFALARSYGVSTWPRLAQACRLIDAIWENDIETVRGLVTRYPSLLH